MMNRKLLAILATVLGGFFAAFAEVAYMSAGAAAAMPFAVGGFDDRYFWLPLSAALILWVLACFGFRSRKRHGRVLTLLAASIALPATGAEPKPPVDVQGNEPRPPAATAAAKPEANTRQTVRIYATQAILGSIPEEGDEARREARAARWDSLMGLFDAALIMAGCEEPRPTFGLDNQTTCLVVGGTTEQMELISQAISACHENERLHPPSAAMELAPANSVVRIYALGRIFGIADSGDETHQKERAAKTNALISQIRTSMAMARLNATMPELSFHGSSNSLIVKGTAAQMELITQAITCWRENTTDHRPIRGQ